MGVDDHFTFVSFDNDLADACLVVLIFEESTNGVVFLDVTCEILFVGNPFCVPILNDAHSQSVWINFLSHISPLLYALSSRITVM